MKDLIFNMSGATLLLLPFVLFLVVCALLGGLVVNFFNINKYWFAVGQMLGITLVSILLVFLLWFLLSRLGYSVAVARFRAPVLLSSWLLSVFVQAGLLKTLNAATPWKSVFLASMLTNLIAYVIIYAILLFSSLPA